jgi:hypothetical protein
MSRWFAMLYTQSGDPIMLAAAEHAAHSDDVPALFASESEAKDAAEDTLFGSAFGYEVYEWPK